MSWTFLYILDGIGIATFLFSYYFNCYRQRYRIDFWHLQLFLLCVLPNMVMLPFSRSDMQELVLGTDFRAVVAVLPKIFLLTLVGYFAVLLGGTFWRLQLGLGIRKATAKVLDVLPNCSLMVMSSRPALIFQSLICLVLQFSILALYFANSGFGFNLRSYTFEHPVLRPFAQIALNYSVVIASHAFARYLDTKERVLLWCTLFLTFGLVFFGSRGTLISIYAGILICYLVKLRDRVKLHRLFIQFSFLILILFYLGVARAGDYSVVAFLAKLGFLLFYGDNFSDLRDFAWVYSAWDHHWWAGRTYLAALTAFVPRFASEFRDTWGMGVVTATTVGFDPQVHPGLRPGSFGESYFNFGVIGVIVVGLLLGIISRKTDIEVKLSFSKYGSMRRAVAYTMLINVASIVAVSVNLSSMYVYIAVYVFTWILLQVLRLTMIGSGQMRVAENG